MPPFSSQYQAIHSLKKALGMDEATYRGMLKDNYNVESSTLLSAGQASALIGGMQKRADGALAQGYGKTKWDHLANRPGMASPKQLRMLEAMWKDVSKVDQPDARKEAFDRFLRNRLNILSLVCMEACDVQKVVSVLKVMKKDKEAWEAQQKKETENAQEG